MLSGIHSREGRAGSSQCDVALSDCTPPTPRLSGICTADTCGTHTGGERIPSPCIAACKVSTTLGEASLVRASASMTSVLQCSKLALPVRCSSWRRSPRTAKYRVRHEAPHWAMVKAAMLSISNLTLGMWTPRSPINNLTPSQICHARVAALSSASAVLNVDTVCLEERHTMMEPPNDMINPDCDLVSDPA